MKDVIDRYAVHETSKRRRPVELFRFYDNDDLNERYTSGDVAVSYGGHTWEPASLERTNMEYDSQLEVSKLTITMDYINPSISDFIANNPADPVWVEVFKLHRDMSNQTADVVFSGQIQEVTLKGTSAQAIVAGFEMFLNRPACPNRFQRQCNHVLFDDGCGLDPADYLSYNYKITDVSADERTIELSSYNGVSWVAGFKETSDDSYYMLGYFTCTDLGESRMIVDADDSAGLITIRYKFNGTVAVNQRGYLYPGCDGNIETCRDRFNNVENFLGFPYIPTDNPAARYLV